VQLPSAPAWRGSERKFRNGAAGSILAAVLLLLAPGTGARGEDSPRPAPELALPALDGTPRGLESVRGRLILVHFFATWCEPCRDEMAALDRLSIRLKDRLAVLAVDVGEPEVRVRRFFDKQQVSFPILIDEDRASMKRWAVNAFPTSFLIDGMNAGLPIRLSAAVPVDWDDPAATRIIERLIAGEAPGIDTLPELKERPSGESQ
jgi:thiol-disulfide isomerase/thioredoxin